MHSTYSDGSLDIEDIAARAAQAGLDFIIITTLYLKGLYEKRKVISKGSWMIGMEANVSQNHYMPDISQEVKNNDEYPQEVIDE